MRCPKCPASPLQESQVRAGVVIDQCPACCGVWFDSAEIYHFVRYPKALYEELAAAYKTVTPTTRLCPRCGVAMLSARFASAGLEFEACPRCGGNWFDAKEVQALNRSLIDRSVEAKPPSFPTPSVESRPAASAAPAAPVRLTERDVKRLLGPNGAGMACGVLAACALVALPAAWAAGRAIARPVSFSEAGLFLIAVAVSLVLVYALGGRRRRYFLGGFLVTGTAELVRPLPGRSGGGAEVEAAFSFEGRDYRLSSRVGPTVASSLRPGAPVTLVVNPKNPAGAYLLGD